MKTSFPLNQILGVLVMAGLPLASHAFIDERTKPEPQATFTPVEVPVTVAAPAQAKKPVQTTTTSVSPHDLNVASKIRITETTFRLPLNEAKPAVHSIQSAQPAFQSGVMGDINNQAWSTDYPGPYGSMPLADALIAQVVPVVGGAVELNGPPHLLERQVDLPTGLTRLETITRMAHTANIGIMIEGNTVSLAMPMAETVTIPGVSTSPVATQAAHQPVIVAPKVAAPKGSLLTQAKTRLPEKRTRPLPKIKETKMWHVEQGAMLSAALNDWASQWGWKIVWQADVDYPVTTTVAIEDDFLSGVEQILEFYRMGDQPLAGVWNERQKVLVIQEYKS